MSRRSFAVEWNDAVRDSDLRTTVKAVAWALRSYMSADGYAYPALVTLAAGASLGRGCTSTKAAILELEAAGFLLVDRKRGRFGWRYQALIPRAAVGLQDELIPREPNAKSHGNRPEIPRAAVAEVVEIERPTGSKQRTESLDGEGQDPASRARAHLANPERARLARRLWGEYAPNHFAQALAERGTSLETAQAVKELLEAEEIAA
jgi:hypothetical protein